MSLSRFKETLRPCSHPSSSAAAASATNLSQASAQFPPSPPPRKPPKSSLSQQLHRLELASFDAQTRPEKEPPPLLGAKEDGREKRDQGNRDDDSPVRFRRKPVAPQALGWDARGPFEALVLSSPGESPVVQVPASINCRLLEHQRQGVRFLYNLYKKNHGGVLGDDMGLGKTIQTIAFLAAVMGKDIEHVGRQVDLKGHHNKSGPILIICPTSVIQNWENEFSEWGDFNVAVYHGPNRDLNLEKLAAHVVEILVTSFDSFRIHDKILSDVPWEIVIVDEAHRLKNEKSQLYKSCSGFKTRKRIGLTGTIMQNKILELFNLFDWVSPGSLGTREHFREYYDEPLKHGQRLSAPGRFVQVAEERKKQLNALLGNYLLRRTKEETIGHLMLGKEDNVVFCAMSDLQKRVYKRMLDQPDFQCLINKDIPCSCGSPLKQVECCNRIVPNGIIWSYLHKGNPEGCESCPFCLVLPCLVKLQQISNHLELIKPNPKDEIVKQRKDAELASAVFGSDIDLVGGSAQTESFMGLSDVEHCGKMRALEKLSSSWTSHGDKILLFSYSVRMLDILEKFLIRKGYCFSRLDGSTPMSSRQLLVDEFNRSPSKQVFLISTRAGGLGLNLVSANRVVVFDPNWNPAQDLQAQDRSFRYGQKQHVTVFRLLAAGSLEELVYSRQVYKQQLSNIAVSGTLEKRYFEGVQDCKAFQGELFGLCNLFRDLSDKIFTSEIIKLHEKHGEVSENCFAIKHTTEDRKDLTMQSLLIGPRFVEKPSVENADKVSLSSKSSALRADMHGGTIKLDDLGIVYSHRNEDIVNMRPGYQGMNGGINPSGGATTRISTRSAENTWDVKCVIERGEPSGKEQKLREYNMIAQFKGMSVLELSKWLLSASPSERNELLQNYKKKKKQKLEDDSR